MLSQNLRFIRYAGIGLCLAVFFSLLVFPSLQGSAAGDASVKVSKEVEEPAGRAPFASSPYNRMTKYISDCSPVGQVLKEFRAKGDPFAPAASLCINGALAPTDPDFNRPGISTNTGGGILAPCAGAAIVDYDFYSFNLTGCAAFPTDVRITLCGPAGCLPVAATDTNMYLYRAVAAGDPLTANGGLPGAFNPASPCTNAVGANASLNGGASNTPPNGNSCNQVTAVCEGNCAANTTASGMLRRLGNGRFTIVITGAGPADAGGYNLFVDAPGAGCAVALAPSAAASEIGGRVLTSNGRGIGKAVVSLSGTGTPMVAKTNPFGYYNFPNLESGMTYTVSVSAKGYTFTNPTRIISLQDAVNDADFTSIE